MFLLPTTNMLSSLVNFYRDTFPKPTYHLMGIEYVAAIQEFNEFFPGYAAMTNETCKKLRALYRNLRATVLLMPLRRSYASAMALDNSVEEWLESNPQKRTPGLTGEHAVAILADYNERVMKKYLKYKTQRLAKLSATAVERKQRANQLIARTNFELKWLLGREEWAKHEQEIQEKYRKSVEQKVREEVRREFETRRS